MRRANAALTEDRRYDDLVARFQKDYLRITTLDPDRAVRARSRTPMRHEAGFDVSAAWLGIGGRLGENVGYFVRGAFERTADACSRPS